MKGLQAASWHLTFLVRQPWRDFFRLVPQLVLDRVKHLSPEISLRGVWFVKLFDNTKLG